MRTILNVLMDERVGGPQLRVLQVAKHLNMRGYETIVVIPQGDRKFSDMLEYAKITYYRLPLKRLKRTINPISHLSYLLFFIQNVLELMKIIKLHSVDLLHINGISHLQIQAPIAAKLTKTKLIWHLNDTTTPLFLAKIMLPLVHWLANKIVVTSPAVLKYLGELLATNDDIDILYPPIDTSKFSPDIKAVELKKSLGINSSDSVVGTIGNFYPLKGYEYFFQAASVIKANYPYVKFLAVGPKLDTKTLYWETISSLISNLGLQNDVILAGYRNDIPELLSIMDVFVMSSISESGPITLIEAMSMGKPVVATNVGIVPEAVLNGKTGIIVPSKDFEAIAEATLYLLKNKEKASLMGIKGRERAKKLFTIERCVDRHEKIYCDVLKSKGRFVGK